MQSCTLLLLYLIGAAMAGADNLPEIPPKLTLRQAIAIALAHSLPLEAAQSRLQQSQARAKAAGKETLPHVSIETYQSVSKDNLRAFGIDTPLINLYPAPYGTFDARLVVSEDLLDPTLRPRQRALMDETEASKGDAAYAREHLISEIVGTFLALQFSQETVRTLEGQAAVARELLAIARQRFEKGEATALEPNRAEQELNRIQLLLYDARASSIQAKLALSQLMSAHITAEFEPVDDAETTAIPTEPEALRMAFESRADYRAVKFRQEAATAALAAVRGKRLPSLRFRMDSGFTGSSPVQGIGTYRAMAVLNIPLYQAGLSAEEAEASAKVRETTAAVEELSNQLQAEVLMSLAELLASREKAEMAERSQLLAEEELALTTSRLKAGISDNTEVLDSQSHALSAAQEKLRSAYGLRRQIAELYRRLGRTEDASRQ